MDESFSIEVVCNGSEYTFEGRLVTVGYTHRFVVMINGLEVAYEPDEERNYRAILIETGMATIKGSDQALIKAVGEKIQSM